MKVPLEHRNVATKKLISHVFPLEHIQEAMNAVKDAKHSMKVVLKIS